MVNEEKKETNKSTSHQGPRLSIGTRIENNILDRYARPIPAPPRLGAIQAVRVNAPRDKGKCGSETRSCVSQ